MKKIKKRFFNHSSLLEKFSKRILRHGKKYKFFKILKNILILSDFLKLKLKLKSVLVPTFIINENFLKKFYPEYSFKVQKKDKLKQLKSCVVNNFNSNELFKWWRLIIFKIKIRSIRLKLLYFFICLYSSESSFLRFSQYSKVSYIRGEKIKSKKVLLN